MQTHREDAMLGRQEVTSGLIEELDRFAHLVSGIDAEGWQRPTRCEGWTVADVAAHLTGSMTDVVAGRLDGLGTPEVTDREVSERRGRTPSELADELRGTTKGAADLLALFDDAAWASPAPGGYHGTLRDGVEALWSDSYIHGDDIRTALGLPSVAGPGLRCAVHHVAQVLTQQGWGPATIAVDGMEELTLGGGGDPRIGGDALRFVNAATGRADPATLGLDESVNIYRA
jgi:uncharacterized protein (TIGR03083 family)